MKSNKTQVSIAMCALALALMSAPALAEGSSQAAADKGVDTGKGQKVVSVQKGNGEKTLTVVGHNGRIAVTGETGVGTGNGRAGMSVRTHGRTGSSALTEEQKAATEQAKADQNAAQEAFTQKLIAAGILSQDAMDAKARVEAAAEVAKTVDTMQWTLEKNIVLRDALKKSGAEKAEALGALVTEGLLTQEQADALYLSTTSASKVNIDQLTVAQTKELQAAGNADYVALVKGFVSQGLISQVDADLMMAKRANSVSASTLTEEQKTALKTARTEMGEELKAIMENLSKAFTTEAEATEAAPAAVSEPGTTTAPASVG